MIQIVQYNNDLKPYVFSFTSECFMGLGKIFDPEGRHYFYKDIPGYFERFWCLVKDGNVIGTVAVKKMDEATLELKALYVDAAYRGQGWGYKLLDQAMTYAEQAGFERVLLDSMSQYESAANLYRDYGFIDTDRFNDNPYADIFMEYRF